MSFYLLATISLLLLCQIINLVLLIRLLLQDLENTVQHLYNKVSTNPTAHHLRNTLHITFTATQVICRIGIRLCNTILLGASKTIHLVRGLHDPTKALILSLIKQIKATLSPVGDSPRLVLCAGYTGKGRFRKKRRIVGGGIWYCSQYEGQGNEVEG